MSRKPQEPTSTGLRHRTAHGLLVAEASIRVDAPPEAVWAGWLDIEARPLWHPRIEWARLVGPAKLGARGAWKPAGARPVSVVVTEFEAPRRLVLRGTHGPPVARGHYEHDVEPLAEGGSRVTHRMSLTGPLARPIRRVLGRPLSAFATPQALAAFGNLVSGTRSAGHR